MRLVISYETYKIKGMKRPKGINERIENVILSLAHVENEYLKRHGNYGHSFDQWLTGGVKGLSPWDYRRRYLDALMLPVHGYKKVREFNKVGDNYYQEKLDDGLIVPFTEEELKKRSKSIKEFSKRDKTDEEGNITFNVNKPFAIVQGRDGQEIRFEIWVDFMMVENDVQLGANPEAMFIQKEDRKCIEQRIARASFTPLEIEAIFMYYQSKNKRKLPGTGKAIQEHLNITRGKYQSLIRRLEDFLDECQSLPKAN